MKLIKPEERKSRWKFIAYGTIINHLYDLFFHITAYYIRNSKIMILLPVYTLFYIQS